MATITRQHVALGLCLFMTVIPWSDVGAATVDDLLRQLKDEFTRIETDLKNLSALLPPPGERAGVSVILSHGSATGCETPADATI